MIKKNKSKLTLSIIVLWTVIGGSTFAFGQMPSTLPTPPSTPSWMWNEIWKWVSSMKEQYNTMKQKYSMWGQRHSMWNNYHSRDSRKYGKRTFWVMKDSKGDIQKIKEQEKENFMNKMKAYRTELNWNSIRQKMKEELTEWFNNIKALKSSIPDITSKIKDIKTNINNIQDEINTYSKSGDMDKVSVLKDTKTALLNKYNELTSNLNSIKQKLMTLKGQIHQQISQNIQEQAKKEWLNQPQVNNSIIETQRANIMKLKTLAMEYRQALVSWARDKAKMLKTQLETLKNKILANVSQVKEQRKQFKANRKEVFQKAKEMKQNKIKDYKTQLKQSTNLEKLNKVKAIVSTKIDNALQSKLYSKIAKLSTQKQDAVLTKITSKIETIKQKMLENKTDVNSFKTQLKLFVLNKLEANIQAYKSKIDWTTDTSSSILNSILWK